MDRKVTGKHSDKPAHQRWLYQLADIGLFKAILIIWGVCVLALVLALFLIKITISSFK
jgi:uncharacterized membrane protein